MKFRHEYKHYINYCDYIVLKQRLEAIMKIDRNAKKEKGYLIRSLYFDNIYDKALKEKLDGILKREKFRIRMYNNDSSYIRLEKKSKINHLCNKQSAVITKKQVQMILDGNYAWMKDSNNKLVIELYSKMNSQLLRPKSIVEYIREPYVFEAGNVRITIDKEIKTGIYSIDFFNENLPLIQAEHDAMILEIKYDEFIPSSIKAIVNLSGRNTTAFSKYGVSRKYC